MRFERRPYQKPITAHIINHPRCNVFATMGSGKTGATMWALNKMFQTGILDDWDQENWCGDRVLVLAPLRVASGTWPAEQVKWQFPALRVVDGTGSRQYREDVMLNDDANVVCCNYDILEWLDEILPENGCAVVKDDCVYLRCKASKVEEKTEKPWYKRLS